VVAVWWDSCEPWVHEIESAHVNQLLADRPAEAHVFEIDVSRVATYEDLFDRFSQTFGSRRTSGGTARRFGTVWIIYLGYHLRSTFCWLLEAGRLCSAMIPKAESF